MKEDNVKRAFRGSGSTKHVHSLYVEKYHSLLDEAKVPDILYDTGWNSKNNWTTEARDCLTLCTTYYNNM